MLANPTKINVCIRFKPHLLWFEFKRIFDQFLKLCLSHPPEPRHSRALHHEICQVCLHNKVPFNSSKRWPVETLGRAPKKPQKTLRAHLWWATTKWSDRQRLIYLFKLSHSRGVTHTFFYLLREREGKKGSMRKLCGTLKFCFPSSTERRFPISIVKQNDFIQQTWKNVKDLKIKLNKKTETVWLLFTLWCGVV